jgi:HSP20 family molecular chaperone IbpA
MDNLSFFKKLASVRSKVQNPDLNIDLAKASLPIPMPQKNAGQDADGPMGQLTVDIYHTPSDIVVESALAGARPEDIDVVVATDSISINGLRRRGLESSDAEYLHQECYWGKFTRSIILPEEVDPENASVKFKDGILSVRMPKTNRKKTRKLEVRMD